METDYFLTLLAYNQWANARIVSAASALDQEQYVTVLPGHTNSLRTTLVHTMSAEWVWYQRCQGVPLTSGLAATDFPTVSALTLAWQEQASRFQQYVTGLSAPDFQRQVSYTTSKGIPYTQPLWHILAHLVNHGTQHRSEAAVMLTSLGFSPGDMDMILYLRDLAG